MAIIKTLRLQAVLLLALCGAVQSFTKSPQPTFLASVSTDPKNHISEVTDCSNEITMTCTKNQASGMSPHLAFVRDDEDIGFMDKNRWKDVSSKENITKKITMDASSYGVHTCAQSGSSIGTFPHKATAKVSMKCTSCSSNGTCTGNAIGKHSYCNTKSKCECKIAGNYGDCKVCDVSTNKGCGDTPYTVRCDEGTCKECEEGTNKGCKAPTPVCLRETDKLKCYPKKSSAATVTSTACLVIASIVVTLMN